MRKINLLLNQMAGFVLALGLVSLTTSCEDLFGEWEKPVLVQPAVTPKIVSSNANGASLIIVNPSVLTGFLKDLQADIEDAAAAGITYKIDIDASAFTPNADPVLVSMIDNADIELNFQNSISISTPLVIQAATGADDTPAAADNKLTVTFPDGTSGLNVEVKMPHTEVVFSGSVTFNELTAITATETLILEEEVAVKTLIWKEGNIVVKGEDAVETIAVETNDDENASLQFMDMTEKILLCVPYADEEGNRYSKSFNIWSDEGEEDGEGNIVHENYYIPKSIKVIKGNGESLIVKNLGLGRFQIPPLENLIVGDGVTLKTDSEFNAKNIIGEGRAKICFTSSGYNNENDEDLVTYYGYVKPVTKFVKNINFTFEPNAEHSDAANLQKLLTIHFFSSFQKSGQLSISFENCAFEENTRFNLGTQDVYFNFEGEGTITTPFEDFTAIISFNECTIGGIAISRATDYIMDGHCKDNSSIRIKIDGTLYNVDWDNDNEKWILTEHGE